MTLPQPHALVNHQQASGGQGASHGFVPLLLKQTYGPERIWSLRVLRVHGQAESPLELLPTAVA
eukprot:CAMPEP_0117694036 /NCGR_PEP_ID=MMETSP0804-20121206/27219_1 /TAXON_ID=1074897 /ORGANISM="Tetraselmis astigmatica, Strain CCMP880" /LENGTH=63 /DNA_ID=CAMNT_0005507669 /DNA_START=192 /DNA_END=383 /DNA_ORIENTATION=+